jgi:hypothetical protein
VPNNAQQWKSLAIVESASATAVRGFAVISGNNVPLYTLFGRREVTLRCCNVVSRYGIAGVSPLDVQIRLGTGMCESHNLDSRESAPTMDRFTKDGAPYIVILAPLTANDTVNWRQIWDAIKQYSCGTKSVNSGCQYPHYPPSRKSRLASCISSRLSVLYGASSSPSSSSLVIASIVRSVSVFSCIKFS